ncbi:spore germination protein [Desulfosporosinus fructosivorans]|uniref:Spore germination protein n=1 Tax=Desulfosporosinus fructosivorans TaxID=2018669 RepID=A0A4Z0R965_9FIRM|nr:spore germination protein [Desulfosporosinus fructosivorans]
MLHKLIKKAKSMRRQPQNFSMKQESKEMLSEQKLTGPLEENLKLLYGALGGSFDVNIREFDFGYQGQNQGALFFLKGMTDYNTIHESIMKPLLYDNRLMDKELSLGNTMERVKKTMIFAGDVQQTPVVDQIIEACLSGKTILLMNGLAEALVIGSEGGASRGIEEPQTDSVVRGPREGFTERLLVNITLVRRKIKNQNFTAEAMTIGRQTKTTVCLAYLKGIVNPRLIEEIRHRLELIQTDAILESGYIEQFIEDAPLSFFSTVGNSERPDVVAAKILEGRAAILVDGSPFALTVPMVFIESFQSAEDYYSRPYLASLIRIIRFLAYSISVLSPAAYVALTSFHQELIPTPLLFTMISAQKEVPFPAVIEAVIMGVIFEILREAGIRLPKAVGQAISIVGAIVIGEAAVSAGLIGQPMVIVVGLTALAGFVVPAQIDSGSLIRLILVILAGLMGGFGLMIGLLVVIVHLASLRSFGTPYLSPLAPLTFSDLKDVFIRAPLWAMLTRPRTIGWHNWQRQESGLKPVHPSEETTYAKDKENE